MQSNGVQIITENNNHWHCVTTICSLPNFVFDYNSLKSTRVSKNLQDQISLLLDADLDAIKINVMDSQFQKGAADCGMYAIATALCHRISPINCLWKQSLM